MAFRTNNSKASEGNFSLKDEGYYEVIIDSAETRTIQSSGKQCVSLTYIIRNDVQQKYQNGLIFHSVWKKKEPNEDDMQVGGFNFGQLMAIAAAAKLPDNQEFAGLDDFLKALCGRAMKVHLYHDDYNDKYYEKIDLHQPTEHPEINHKSKPKPDASGYKAPQTSFAAAAHRAPASVPAVGGSSSGVLPAAAHRVPESVPAAPAEGDDDYPF